MLQNIPKEKILEIVRQGPTIPQKIVKIVGGDTMLIGAILSTMISTGDVKYSILKVGGSPLYYVPEHEPKLEEFLQYLNDKDQKTAKTLKEQKVMQDSAQDPLTRVSLKTIRDFAKPFEIDDARRKELFYRYFLADKEEAEKLALSMLKSKEKLTQTIITNEQSSAADKTIAKQYAVSEEFLDTPKDVVKAVEDVVKEVKDVKEIKDVSSDASKASESKHAKKHKTVTESETVETKTTEVTIDKQAFYELIKAHIHKLNLDIISKEKIKKTEYVLVLKNHDTNEYSYCVAKDKKVINEGDLSTAFVFAHQKKMPCIFLTTGHLNKKAESMTHKEFKDMKIEKI